MFIYKIIRIHFKISILFFREHDQERNKNILTFELKALLIKFN